MIVKLCEGSFPALVIDMRTSGQRRSAAYCGEEGSQGGCWAGARRGKYYWMSDCCCPIRDNGVIISKQTELGVMSQLLSAEKILIVPLINMLVLKNVVEDIISLPNFTNTRYVRSPEQRWWLMQSMNLRCSWYSVLSPRPRPCPSPFPASQGGHTVSNVLTTNWHDEEFSGRHKTARREGRAPAAQHSIYQIKW